MQDTFTHKALLKRAAQEGLLFNTLPFLYNSLRFIESASFTESRRTNAPFSYTKKPYTISYTIVY